MHVVLQGMHANTYYNHQVNEYLHVSGGRQGETKRTKPGKLGSLQTTDAERCSGGAWLGPKPKPQVPEDIHVLDVNVEEIPAEFKELVDALMALYEADSTLDPDDPSLGKK